jgi:hypothetical protein
MIGSFGARIMVLAGAALTLTACDAVMSRQPLFTAEDSVGAPTLKPGVWADLPCTLELLRQHSHACGIYWEVTSTTVKMALDEEAIKQLQSQSKTSRPPEKPFQYLLSAGDPPILQIDVPDLGYEYYGVSPVSHADDDSVVEADYWPVLCGPPAPRKSDAEIASATQSNPWYQPPPTDAPFSGIKVDGGVCETEDRAALMNAAHESRDVESKVIPFNHPGGERVHWITAVAP